MKAMAWLAIAVLAAGLLALAGCKNQITPQLGETVSGTAAPETVAPKTEAPEAESAELRFSSFDGGGPEYSARLDDPTLAAVSSKQDYRDRNHEAQTGSAYEMVFRFRGLRPGSTQLTVLGDSPIMGMEVHLYTLTVDEGLNVSLRARQSLSRLTVFRSGSIQYDSYAITPEAEGYVLTVNEEARFPLSQQTVDAVYAVFEKYELAQWDGFNQSMEGVLDGESFWMEAALTDGTTIFAAGDNSFPAHYFDAMGELWTILTEASQGEADAD